MAIWNALRIYGIFYNHLVNFLPFGTFFPVLVSCTKKNLANLVETGELFHLLNATLSEVHAPQISMYKLLENKKVCTQTFWQMFCSAKLLITNVIRESSLKITHLQFTTLKLIFLFSNTYVHPYIHSHTYIHTYIHADIHAQIPAIHFCIANLEYITTLELRWRRQ
jgi:hypothetical protein